MNLPAMIVVVVAGLMAGWLASVVLKGGVYGVTGDVMAGVAGSLVGGAVFNVLASMPGKEWSPVIAAAFVGAVVFIVAQRWLWQART